MLKRLYSYIDDLEFRFTVFEDKIHIINYLRIITLEEDLIAIMSSNKKINIIGNNFILHKLVDKEMLISGDVSKIEVYSNE